MTDEICKICGKEDPAGLRAHLWRAHGIHLSQQAEYFESEKKPSKVKKVKKLPLSHTCRI